MLHSKTLDRANPFTPLQRKGNLCLLAALATLEAAVDGQRNDLDVGQRAKVDGLEHLLGVGIDGDLVGVDGGLEKRQNGDTERTGGTKQAERESKKKR